MNKRIVCAALVLLLALVAFGVSFVIAKNREEMRLVDLEPGTSASVPVSDNTGTDATTPSESETAAEPGGVSEGPEETEAPTYVISDDDVLPVPEIVNMPADENWSIVLINEFYQMNDTYEPVLSLIPDNEAIYLDQRVTDAFVKMAEAAAADGITLTVAAGYVTPDRQARLFDKEVQTLMLSGLNEDAAQAKAAFTVLPSRCSEANYGLSVDIGWLEADFAESEVYRWLKNHAAAYGFIERYTEKGQRITHFNACPWHWRYVGVDHADYIVEHNITLEEYVGKVH